MNIMRGNPEASFDRANHHHPHTQRATRHRRRTAGGSVAFLLLLLTTLIPASSASAVVGDNKFRLDDHTISVLPASYDEAAQFVGKVTMDLELSNEVSDRVRLGVEGELILNEPGCAKLRISYLDADKNVVPGGVEHSELLISPDEVEGVDEWSKHRAYRNTRLEVLYGSTCSTLTVVAAKTSYLSAEMSTLGDGERWVSGIETDDGTLTYNGGTATFNVRWDAATNPAPIPDRGDARITAVLAHPGAGCSKLQAKHYDVANGYLGTTWSDEVCGPLPTKVTLSNFASNADLHRISIRIRHRPRSGPMSYSIPRDYFLD